VVVTGVSAERQAELRSAYPDAWSWPAFEWARMEERRSIPATYKVATELMVTGAQMREAAELQIALYNLLMYGQHPAPAKGTQGRSCDRVWVDEAQTWVSIESRAASPVTAEAARDALSPLPRYVRLDEGSPPVGPSWS
jgi:hypothetical protein